MATLDPTDVVTHAGLAEIRRIATTVERSLLERLPACLLITSAAPQEGKTLVAAALATSFALQGRHRVLAADCNWHQPSLHERFGLAVQPTTAPPAVGTPLETLTRASPVPGLDVLTAPASAATAELDPSLAVEIALDHLRQAARRYDLVIVDGRAVFPVNRAMMVDPVALAAAVDAVALVVLSGVTPRQQAKRAQMALAAAGGKHLGVVVNQWRNPLR